MNIIPWHGNNYVLWLLLTFHCMTIYTVLYCRRYTQNTMLTAVDVSISALGDIAGPRRLSVRKTRRPHRQNLEWNIWRQESDDITSIVLTNLHIQSILRSSLPEILQQKGGYHSRSWTCSGQQILPLKLAAQYYRYLPLHVLDENQLLTCSALQPNYLCVSPAGIFLAASAW